ncbi:MAG: hypothetical protein KatS3mg008_1190 [Acidimicrobiales bacterium]|nr:MAG: hypothetical protein KatS3mg008_1190 [Acidimicrobiales bacterium]
MASPMYAGEGRGATGDRTPAILAHALALVAGFIAPLIVYLVYKDKDAFVRHHAAEALNFQITVIIAVVGSAVLTLVLIGILLLPVVGIGALVLTIVGAVKAAAGEWWRYPLSIRFVSGAIEG